MTLARRNVLAAVLLAGAAASARATGLPRRHAFALAGAEEWAFTTRGGRRYRILISRPEGEAPGAGWPVLYALDGNAMFEVLTGATRFLPQPAQGLVVAIDFPLDETEPRRRDFEYTLPDPQARYPSGGADALLTALVEELRPAIDAAFRTDPARQALFGHSYGGLFVLHALFTRPGAFSTYVAASPSIWWGEGMLLREAEAFGARPAPNPPPRLLMTYGELEGRPRPDGPGSAASPRGARRNMAANVRDMAGLLRGMTGHLAALEVQEFPGEGHGSVRAAAAGRAAPFAFPPSS